MTLNVLSLFAGIGGLRPLELGLERAGMTVVGQVEIDPFCRRVLAKHWPEVPRHDDVRTAVDWWLSEPRPAADVVCGGFPCQDISNAGRREGIAGSRSGLWSHMRDTVRALRPRYVVMENVAAILVRGLDVVAADLAEIGYDLEWDCVPASAVGAPHRRDRWWGVAYPDQQQLRLEPVGEFGGCGAPVARADGPAEPLANASSDRRRQGRARGPAGRGPDREGQRPEALADASSIGRQSGWRGHSGTPVRSQGDDEPRGGGPQLADALRPGLEGRGLRWATPERGWTWSTEPGVGRVADGVPARVDRLRALGNAVVPQVAEHIGRLIVEAEAEAAA